MIGIAGGPGSGKSTLARRLAERLSKEHTCPTLVVPMDGYHISKNDMKMLTKLGKIQDDRGEVLSYEEAMSRRGAPFTYDHEQLIMDLQDARKTGEASFPVYNRDISDPELDGVKLESKHQVVLCEGNYLLALEEPAWAPLRGIWDDRWYIHVNEDVVKERLIDRHMVRWNHEKECRFGKGRDGARKKVEESDWKNSQWVAKHSQRHANLIIDNNQ